MIMDPSLQGDAVVDKKISRESMEIAVGITVSLAVIFAIAGVLVWYIRRSGDSKRTLFGSVRPPPAGPETTLVVTDIQDSTKLWETLDSSVMDESINLHHSIIRKCILSHSGYESATEGDSFIIAFFNAEDSVNFSWPEELLAVPLCAPMYCLRTGAINPLSVKARNIGNNALRRSNSDQNKSVSWHLEGTTSIAGRELFNYAKKSMSASVHGGNKFLTSGVGAGAQADPKTFSRTWTKLASRLSSWRSNDDSANRPDMYQPRTSPPSIDLQLQPDFSRRGPRSLYRDYGTTGQLTTGQSHPQLTFAPVPRPSEGLIQLRPQGVSGTNLSFDSFPRLSPPEGPGTPNTLHLLEQLNHSLPSDTMPSPSTKSGQACVTSDSDTPPTPEGRLEIKLAPPELAVTDPGGLAIVHEGLKLPSLYGSKEQEDWAEQYLLSKSRPSPSMLHQSTALYHISGPEQQAEQRGLKSRPSPSTLHQSTALYHISGPEQLTEQRGLKIRPSPSTLSRSTALYQISEPEQKAEQSGLKSIPSQFVPVYHRPGQEERTGQSGVRAPPQSTAGYRKSGQEQRTERSEIKAAPSQPLTTQSTPGTTLSFRSIELGRLVPTFAHSVPLYRSPLGLEEPSDPCLPSPRYEILSTEPNLVQLASIGEATTVQRYLDRACKIYMVEGPGRTLIFRGLRVRIGIHTGITNPLEHVFNKQSGRVQYVGEALSKVKAVGDAAGGGVILLTAATHSMLPVNKMLAQVAVAHMGDHILSVDKPAEVIYAAQGQELMNRFRLLGSIKTKQLVCPGFLDAPFGKATIAFMSVVGSQSLFAWNSTAAAESIAMFQSLCQRQLNLFGGYLVEATNDGLCLAAFPAGLGSEAIRGRDYLSPKSPPVICKGLRLRCRLDSGPAGARDYTEEWTQGLETALWTGLWGLRLRCGLDSGEVMGSIHAASGRMTYRGRVMNRAARIACVAGTGQVWCTEALWNNAVSSINTKCCENLDELVEIGGCVGDPRVSPELRGMAPHECPYSTTGVQAESMGEVSLKGIYGSIRLMQCAFEAA
eukprot:gene5939-33516_t